MQTIEIPNAAYFLPEARQLTDFLEPIANRLKRMVKGGEYANFFTNLDHVLDETGEIDQKHDKWALAKLQKRRVMAQWSNHWEQLLALANARGWRVTRVDVNGEPDFLFFTPKEKSELTIFTFDHDGGGSLSDTDQKALSAALALQGFELVETTISALHYRARAGINELEQVGESSLDDMVENPFPNAHECLNRVKQLNYWLELVSKRVRDQAKNCGCALIPFREPAHHCSVLETVLGGYEQAGWRVTKVYAGAALKLLFFSPAKQDELTLNLPRFEGYEIGQDDLANLIGQLNEQGFVVTEVAEYVMRFATKSKVGAHTVAG